VRKVVPILILCIGAFIVAKGITTFPPNRGCDQCYFFILIGGIIGIIGIIATISAFRDGPGNIYHD
jgi:hypothetical protein